MPKKTALTHVTKKGDMIMVDVSQKEASLRRAVARATVRVSADAARAVDAHSANKGDVLAAVRLAAIMASKKTPELIPLCHGLNLDKTTVDVSRTKSGFVIDVTCVARDRTGVEMEAMTAASVGALTLYDMIKAVDRAASFDVHLVEKSGGTRGDYLRSRDGETKERR
jgi:cyclic pyranopterin phosphate synthase